MSAEPLRRGTHVLALSGQYEGLVVRVDGDMVELDCAPAAGWLPASRRWEDHEWRALRSFRRADVSAAPLPAARSRRRA